MKKIICYFLLSFLIITSNCFADYLVPNEDFKIRSWTLKRNEYYKIINIITSQRDTKMYSIKYDSANIFWVEEGEGKFTIVSDNEYKNYIKKEEDKIKQQKAKESSIFEEKYKKRQEECKDSIYWLYNKSFDKMRNKETSYAETISINEFDLGFPYHRVSCKILIRKGASSNPSNAINLILSEGQFHRSEIISVKFDNSAIEQYST
jgi:hypothetical protein